MATIKLYLDKRKPRRDGTCPLKVMVNDRSKTCFIPTSVYILPEQWDPHATRVIGRPDKATLNKLLVQHRQGVEDIVIRLAMSGEIISLNISQLKERIEEEMLPEEMRRQDKTRLFAYNFMRFADLHGGRTREIYMVTYKRLREFMGEELQELSFNDITKEWLTRFEKHLSKHSPSKNARNIHLRNIRAVFNDAIDNYITTAYPFRKFRIRNEETPKRSLTVEQLRELATRDLEPFQERYRDIFMLMFYLCGINVIDLLALKEVTGEGRVEYRRSKTHKLYSIKVEPEALEIIERYRGHGALLNVTDTSTYLQFSHRMNYRLKHILPSVPQLSTYWARHTWATIAASLDIPKETISAALGHELGNPVTSIYINFDRAKIDDANRRVIDYVMGK